MLSIQRSASGKPCHSALPELTPGSPGPSKAVFVPLGTADTGPVQLGSEAQGMLEGDGSVCSSLSARRGLPISSAIGSAQRKPAQLFSRCGWGPPGSHPNSLNRHVSSSWVQFPLHSDLPISDPCQLTSENRTLFPFRADKLP